MTETEVRSLFTLAKIPILSLLELPNNYWPEVPQYAELRKKHPWWLIRTPRGYMRIGWRKRVISIHWEDTNIRRIVTEDQVTKDTHMVHAWDQADALKYLSVLAPYMTQFPTPEDQEQVEAIVLRNGVQWQYVNGLIVLGICDGWTFLIHHPSTQLNALAVCGPKFVDLNADKTAQLRQHFETVNGYDAVPIFKA